MKINTNALSNISPFIATSDESFHIKQNEVISIRDFLKDRIISDFHLFDIIISFSLPDDCSYDKDSDTLTVTNSSGINNQHLLVITIEKNDITLGSSEILFDYWSPVGFSDDMQVKFSILESELSTPVPANLVFYNNYMFYNNNFVIVFKVQLSDKLSELATIMDMKFDSIMKLASDIKFINLINRGVHICHDYTVLFNNNSDFAPKLTNETESLLVFDMRGYTPIVDVTSLLDIHRCPDRHIHPFNSTIKPALYVNNNNDVICIDPVSFFHSGYFGDFYLPGLFSNNDAPIQAQLKDLYFYANSDYHERYDFDILYIAIYSLDIDGIYLESEDPLGTKVDIDIGVFNPIYIEHNRFMCKKISLCLNNELYTVSILCNY